MGTKRPRAPVFARVRAHARMSLIASLLLCGAALPAFASSVADLGSRDADARLQAARALGLARDKSAVNALVKALKAEANPAARQAMVAALGAAGDGSVVPVLLDLARRSDDPGTRAGAVAALYRLGTPQAIAGLETLAGDSGQASAARRSALIAVANRGDAAALPILRAAAADQDAELRASAMGALSRIRTPEARALVDAAAQGDADESVRKAARAALKRQEGQLR